MYFHLIRWWHNHQLVEKGLSTNVLHMVVFYDRPSCLCLLFSHGTKAPRPKADVLGVSLKADRTTAHDRTAGLWCGRAVGAR